jgi:endonuclease/exonuclease/phosphatase family metal-dependent hydrolase
MRILRTVWYVLMVPIGAFLLFLLYASVNDYKPEEKIQLYTANTPAPLPDTSVFDLLIWNIGYAGLDASMDFFYDGGEQIRPSKKGVSTNLQGIRSTLKPFNAYDFVLLQEVDIDSKRSYFTNQAKAIGDDFPGYFTFTGINYKVFFVPIPPSTPMGKVESGLLSLSKHKPASVNRHSFPGNYSWPMSLFMLDRCFMVQRHPVSDGNELVILNTQNSAYDDGSLRTQQMNYLKDFLINEYEKGNYLIVGGDWNQTPFGFEPELPSFQFDTENLTYVEEGFPGQDWTWAFDTRLPTNRRVNVPYQKATSLTTVIDYFLLSPNIIAEEVETIDTGFLFSDHQPVRLVARLNP